MPWDQSPTYKGDQGSQQQDAHQKVLELLQHQLPQGLAWEWGHRVRAGPGPAELPSLRVGSAGSPSGLLPPCHSKGESPRPQEAWAGALSGASLCWGGGTNAAVNGPRDLQPALPQPHLPRSGVLRGPAATGARGDKRQLSYTVGPRGSSESPSHCARLDLRRSSAPHSPLKSHTGWSAPEAPTPSIKPPQTPLWLRKVWCFLALARRGKLGKLDKGPRGHTARQ